MLDVTPTLLRFWERRFDIVAPHRNKKGNRLFSAEDVRNLKTIYHLVKERGMTLAGAEKQLRAARSSVERDVEIAERLGAIRALLVEVRNELGGGGVVVGEEFEGGADETVLAVGSEIEAVATAAAIVESAVEVMVEPAVEVVVAAELEIEPEVVERELEIEAEVEVEQEAEIKVEEAEEEVVEMEVVGRFIEQTLF